MKELFVNMIHEKRICPGNKNRLTTELVKNSLDPSVSIKKLGLESLLKYLINSTTKVLKKLFIIKPGIGCKVD